MCTSLYPVKFPSLCWNISILLYMGTHDGFLLLSLKVILTDTTKPPSYCNVTIYYKTYWRVWYSFIWVTTWENLSSVVCKQQKCRPACLISAFVIRLIGKYHIKIYSKRHFPILDSLCTWAGWFWYSLIGNPGDRFLSWRGPFLKLANITIAYHLVFQADHLGNGTESKLSIPCQGDRTFLHILSLFLASISQQPQAGE